MFAGQVTPGASVSTTVTEKPQVELFPAASVAVTVTTVTPFGNAVPEGCELVTVTSVQLSVACGSVKLTAAVH